MNIKVVAFDADDTLFVNEPYFEETEKKFCGLMEDYLSRSSTSQALYKTQIDNLPLYGYGIKGYMLSMVEAAITISEGTVTSEHMAKIIEIGKELIQKPIELLPDVEETLDALSNKYKLIVATKGDLKDQQRKLHDSGLGHYFHHIEVMSDKRAVDYSKLLQRLEIRPSEFMMIGNSLRSDVLPVLEIGGYACHIPFHTTWAHEQVEHEVAHENFHTLEKITDILPLLLPSG